MHFEIGNLYHIYNQGNNHQPIFFSRENYLYLLRKMRKELAPLSDILSYCLMPNHFHWLLYVKEEEYTRLTTLSGQTSDVPHPLNRKIGTLQSSYTRAINKQQNRSGSLFRQKTKAVEIDSIKYGLTCMHYIHQNPLKAKLVNKIEEWEFSSFRDYAGIRNGTLVNKKIAFKMFGINLDALVEDSYSIVNSNLIDKIT